MELINLFMNKKENKSINVSDVQVWMYNLNQRNSWMYI